MSKAPIANGTTNPAASGPSASKAHGTGEPFKGSKSNPGRQPNQSLVTESISTASGSENIGNNGDHGKGKTAAPISNNDISGSPAPR